MIKKGKKEMVHRKLTLEEQLRGVRAAILSPKTPIQLKQGLRKRAKELTRRLGRP